MNRRRLFLVRRCPRYCEDESYHEYPVLRDSAAGGNGVWRAVPVALFPTREAAEAEADRLEHAARETLNPVWLTGYETFLARVTPTPQLDELKARSPQPPPPLGPEAGYEEQEQWYARQARWYDEHSPAWTPSEREGVWLNLLGYFRLHDVVEIPFDDTPD